MSVTHELKTIPPWFAEVFYGNKTAELRRNDRNFRVGDHLRLREYFPEDDRYSLSEVLAQITHVVDDCDYDGLAEGYCMLSLKIIALKS